ncbi:MULTISPECIES: hypothetical protein [Erwiniaceae]|uniref:hypothetical protein n=1 Tax=Erwiniaceae TaxID=1903409 RepID=UPI0019097B8F|nr:MULTISPECIES: hypothetical protein [Erwiniaceae]MBK0093284.1 hypothetical protein [Erwinia sp. S59]MBK0127727.1 hypothetical protein [Pantoea sp. S61]
MKHDGQITQEILGLLGTTVSAFIREGLAVETHEISLALQKLKDNEADSVLRENYETLIRLLSKMMH